jgi:general secretion pathway protein D
MMKNFPLPVGISPASASAGVGLLLALSLGLPSVAAQNQNPTTSPLAAESERAIVRSQENLTRARSLMHDALGKKTENNLEGAYRDALEALELTPSGDAVKSARAGLVGDYTTIALAYARELIRNGRYQDAESVAKSVLDPSVNPSNREAVGLLSDLEQPERFNKTVTPKSAAQRDQVVKLLREAEQLGQSGRNELALRRYDEVLQIDPYNNAARKGMQEINLTKMKYADEAYNETRSRMLWQVEKAWERPPRKTKQGRSTESVGRQQDIRGTEQIVAKMNSIIIPKIDLSDSPISEAVEYLKQKSVEQDPAKKGVNIFLKMGAPTPAPAASPGTTEGMAASSSTPSGAGEPHVSLILNQVPLYVALDYLCKLSNLKLKIDPYAVSIVPLSEPTDILVTKEYQVPPTFIPPKPLNAGGGIPQAGGGVSDPNTPRVAGRYNAQEYLLSQGVDFPPGASANYLPSGSKLVVRNTRDNIDVIDALVDAAMGVAPSQVDIQTKFLEINQNNLQELGFSWLLGPFSIGGGVYGSGGGNSAVNSANYPFGNPMAGGYPMSPVGSVRSGDQAITGNSVDSVLAGKTGVSDATAPGIFSIAGVFTDPQFQLVIRALNQKKGIDLMSAPKVTTKSGVKATVKIVNEFIYPRQYDPPQFQQGQPAQGGTTTVNPLTVPPPTVTPAFPRDFTHEDLGVTLEATPKIGPDGYTIDLELHPKVVDFDGFINYGAPINGVGYKEGLFITAAGLPIPSALIPTSQNLTTNRIEQPVFSYREVNTFVTVWDGQTVALGGLIREDVQKIQDKVPFLGDIPLAGRLFRSDTDQKLKKNLVIFVTPRILDAEGQPRRGDMEEPEIVTPLGLPEDLPQPSVTTPAVRTK